jgi:hypothetical protein
MNAEIIGFRVNFLLVNHEILLTLRARQAYGVPSPVTETTTGTFRTILVSPWLDQALLVFQQMKMLVVQHFTLRPKAQVIKQEVVGSMRCRNRVKADNARVGLLHPVSLGFPLLVCLGFFGKFVSVDKLVAP